MTSWKRPHVTSSSSFQGRHPLPAGNSGGNEGAQLNGTRVQRSHEAAAVTSPEKPRHFRRVGLQLRHSRQQLRHSKHNCSARGSSCRLARRALQISETPQLSTLRSLDLVALQPAVVATRSVALPPEPVPRPRLAVRPPPTEWPLPELPVEPRAREVNRVHTRCVTCTAGGSRGARRSRAATPIGGSDRRLREQVRPSDAPLKKWGSG